METNSNHNKNEITDGEFNEIIDRLSVVNAILTFSFTGIVIGFNEIIFSSNLKTIMIFLALTIIAIIKVIFVYMKINYENE